MKTVNGRKIKALPLTRERFAAYGDVLESSLLEKQGMNSARFERFFNLAAIDVDGEGDGHPAISIARCRVATALPCRVDMLERHPLGSQAFMPLSRFPFVVAVAPFGEEVDEGQVEVFVTNGRQGINYHRGVWHMPMIGLEEGNEFLIVDRSGQGENCDEHYLAEPLLLEI